MRTKKNEITPLINGKQMAELLDVNYFSIMLWSEKNLIPSIKVGRCRRFDPEEVIQWLKDGKMEEARRIMKKDKQEDIT